MAMGKVLGADWRQYTQDGQLYEQDLGPTTGATARAMTRFDPGPGWQAVNP